ncbi:nucleoside diphosphate phosphatase ENTPD5 [Pelodytes ibericus]
MAGPFPSMPLDNLRVSPLGVVPKREAGKIRRSCKKMSCLISLLSTTWVIYVILAISCYGCCLSEAEPIDDLKSIGVKNSTNTVYGIVLDAGSTGTRIHIYTFKQGSTGTVMRFGGSPLQLQGEVFESLKPGLSEFADQPKKGAETVQRLLDIAKNVVPTTHWSHTPIILKATAGLRLLPHHKAEALLTEIRNVFRASPFLIPDNSVSIMDGTDEGILAWVGVNFLTGRLNGHHTVGILDLGGGSTQITFLPLSKATLDDTPKEFISTFELFNSTYRLYTHSYLGLGLKAARLAVLGASNSEAQQGQIFRSHCLPQALLSEWDFAGVTYRYGGKSHGITGFNACYLEVQQIVQGKLHQVAEIQGTQFYAFSYIYDRAVESELIDYEAGGILQVGDFAIKALEVCENMDKYSSQTPFLCMDLTYIAVLLREGFGFEDTILLQLTKKMDDVEMSWTLGAIFHVLQSLA